MIIFCGFLGLSYLLGGIPTGVLVGKLKGVDVRRQGSGNVGATNVARVVGKLPGLFVLVVDTAKGWVPVVLFSSWAVQWGVSIPVPELKILFGAAAVVGHIWNPFLQLNGGKGVATALGVLCGLDPRVAASACGVWLITVIFTRYVSVASVAAALAAPFLMVLFNRPLLWILGAIGVSLAVIARHRSNFLRLLHGEEHPIGNRSSKISS